MVDQTNTGQNPGILTKRNMTRNEKESIKLLTTSHETQQFHKAIKYINGLENAYKEGLLDAKTREYFEQAEKSRDAFEARTKNYQQNSDHFVKDAEVAKGDQTPIERIAHLAMFNPESLAFMMLFMEVGFIIDILFSATGGKLAFGGALEHFEETKKTDPEQVFDYADYLYPLGNSPEEIKEREKTQDKLREKNIYNYKFDNNNAVELIGKPIVDPREINLEILAANRLMAKPTKLSQIRRSAITYNVQMIGASPDLLYWIDNGFSYELNCVIVIKLIIIYIFFS